MKILRIPSLFRRFKRDESGVALVEFAMFLPIFVLSFAIIVEFARVFFSYQGAVEGVRDAARYLARVTPGEICVGAGGVGGVLNVTNPGDGSDDIRNVIIRNMDNEDGFLPEKVVLGTVSTTYVCVLAAAGTYRQEEVPIAQVSAQVTINLPLEGVFRLNGINDILRVEHTIVDQSRIYGV